MNKDFLDKASRGRFLVTCERGTGRVAVAMYKDKLDYTDGDIYLADYIETGKNEWDGYLYWNEEKGHNHIDSVSIQHNHSARPYEDPSWEVYHTFKNLTPEQRDIITLTEKDFDYFIGYLKESTYLVTGEIKEINGVKKFRTEYDWQGHIYKDRRLESWDNNEVVYIAESTLQDLEVELIDKIDWYELEGVGYRRTDFEAIAGKKLARLLFDEVDWQSPDSRYMEWDENYDLEEMEKEES